MAICAKAATSLRHAIARARGAQSRRQHGYFFVVHSPTCPLHALFTFGFISLSKADER
jgi:hypothetical protein